VSHYIFIIIIIIIIRGSGSSSSSSSSSSKISEGYLPFSHTNVRVHIIIRTDKARTNNPQHVSADSRAEHEPTSHGYVTYIQM
jgi:hypothetical protein